MSKNSDKKVTVRIPLAIDPKGNWIATGSNQTDWDWDDFMEGVIEHCSDFYKRYWITAELPIDSDLRNILGTVDRDDC